MLEVKSTCRLGRIFEAVYILFIGLGNQQNINLDPTNKTFRCNWLKNNQIVSHDAICKEITFLTN